MSGTFPQRPNPRAAIIRSYSPTIITRAHNLRRQASSRGAHQWQIDLAFPPMDRDTFSPIWSFLVSQRGQLGTFEWAFWKADSTDLGLGPRGQPLGSPVVDGADQSGRTLATRGWRPNAHVLRRGDFLRLPSSRKVYMVTAEAISDATGRVSVAIEPALVTSPTASESLIVKGVTFHVAMSTDTVEAAMRPPLWFDGLSLTLTEEWY